MSESSQADTADAVDTPVHRATIDQFNIEDLDAMLDAIRERRLIRVRQLEAIANKKADDHYLATYIKYEKAYNTAKKAIAKLDAEIDRVEALTNKARALALEMEVDD